MHPLALWRLSRPLNLATPQTRLPIEPPAWSSLDS